TRVLVAATFRPPSLQAPTLGEPPKDVAQPSDEIAFPLTAALPAYPPLAYGAGVALLEARVDPSGLGSDLAVLRSAAPFDAAALPAARQWRFRPARVGGAPVSTFVYLLFGFPLPVASAPLAPGLPSGPGGPPVSPPKRTLMGPLRQARQRFDVRWLERR